MSCTGVDIKAKAIAEEDKEAEKALQEQK